MSTQPIPAVVKTSKSVKFIKVGLSLLMIAVGIAIAIDGMSDLFH